MFSRIRGNVFWSFKHSWSVQYFQYDNLIDCSVIALKRSLQDGTGSKMERRNGLHVGMQVCSLYVGQTTVSIPGERRSLMKDFDGIIRLAG